MNETSTMALFVDASPGGRRVGASVVISITNMPVSETATGLPETSWYFTTTLYVPSSRLPQPEDEMTDEGVKTFRLIVSNLAPAVVSFSVAVQLKPLLLNSTCTEPAIGVSIR